MVIVGRSAWPGYGKPYKAFLYSNGLMRSIGGSQSASFTPEAINDNGWITGTLGTPGGAVFWINDRIISLGTLPGFVGSEGMSLNNSGIVVGNLLGSITATYTNDGTIYTDTYVGSTGVFIYNGRMQNLNDLVDGGWKITAVGHINDAGQIVATGVRPGSRITYALLITPELGR